jgi:hypothetical protein
LPLSTYCLCSIAKTQSLTPGMAQETEKAVHVDATHVSKLQRHLLPKTTFIESSSAQTSPKPFHLNLHGFLQCGRNITTPNFAARTWECTVQKPLEWTVNYHS